jgi:hypothetical protein
VRSDSSWWTGALLALPEELVLIVVKAVLRVAREPSFVCLSLVAVAVPPNSNGPGMIAIVRECPGSFSFFSALRCIADQFVRHGTGVDNGTAGRCAGRHIPAPFTQG